MTGPEIIGYSLAGVISIAVIVAGLFLVGAWRDEQQTKAADRRWRERAIRNENEAAGKSKREVMRGSSRIIYWE